MNTMCLSGLLCGMFAALPALVSMVDASPDELVQACKSGDYAQVQELVAEGKKVSAPGSDGVLPLMAACLNGQDRVARFLVEKGANVKKTDDYGWTPLAGAAMSGHLELVKFLVEQGADPSGKGARPLPIECAVQSGKAELVKYLLEQGASPNVESKSGVSLLMDACGRGNMELVRMLLEHGADMKFRSKIGRDCMTSACFGGHAEVVKFLHGKGLSLASADEHGGSCLLFAAMSGKGDLVEYILREGKDEQGKPIEIDVPDKDGNTPLLVLVSRIPHKGMDAKMMDLLMALGADPDHANKEGQTAKTLLKEFSGNLSDALKRGEVKPGLKSLLEEMQAMEGKMEKKTAK